MNSGSNPDAGASPELPLAAFEWILSELPVAILLIEVSSTVHWMNAAAGRVVSEADALTVDGAGTLRALRKTDDVALQHLIRQAEDARQRVSVNIAVHLSLMRRTGERP